MTNPKLKFLHPHTSDSRTSSFGFGLANLKEKLRGSLFTIYPFNPILFIIFFIVISWILTQIISCLDMNNFKFKPAYTQFKGEYKWLWDWTIKKLTGKPE